MSLNNKEKELSYKALVAAIIFWILLLAWMLMIFFFSGETGSESASRSAKIAEFLRDLGIFPFITQTVIRKGAHVTEYAILTIFAFNSVKYTNLISPSASYSQTPVKIIKSDNEMYIIISLWISAVYAAIDEYHQLFVSGRNGSIFDFLIDMCGSIVVLSIIRVIFTMNLRRHGEMELRYD